MGLIASALPRSLKEHFIRRQLVSGSVVKILVAFGGQPAKLKRLVVLSATDSIVCVVVNSELHPILAKSPATKRAQIAVTPADGNFIEHDSFINCAEVRTFSTAAVIAELVADPACILGNISAEVRAKIVVALRTSRTIPPVQTKPLIEALGG